MQMYMNVINKIILCTFLCVISSCKDEPLIDTISGKYKVTVEVIQRPAVYPQNPEPRAGYFRKFRGTIIYDSDTSNVCCQDFGDEHGCPMSYSFHPLEIIKTDDGYAIKNETDSKDSYGNPFLFNIPLSYSSDELTFEGSQKFSRASFLGDIFSDGDPSNDQVRWPYHFVLHYFKLKKISKGKLEGEWYFRDTSSICLFTTLGEYATMGEYAKITLTKMD